MEHVPEDLTLCFSLYLLFFIATVFPIVLNHVLVHINFHLINSHQPPVFCLHISSINITEFVLEGIHNELFAHSYNPFKHATSSQPVISASQLVRFSSSHLVSRSVRVAMGNGEEPSLSTIPWQQGLLNVYVG